MAEGKVAANPVPVVLAFGRPLGPQAPAVFGVFFPGSPKKSRTRQGGSDWGSRGRLRGHFLAAGHVYNDRGSHILAIAGHNIIWFGRLITSFFACIVLRSSWRGFGGGAPNFGGLTSAIKTAEVPFPPPCGHCALLLRLRDLRSTGI